MDDLTNLDDNRGKPIHRRRIQVSMTPSELATIAALADMPSERVQNNPELMQYAGRIATKANALLDLHTGL